LNGARTDNEVKVFIEYINNLNYNWGRSGAPYGGECYAGATRSHTANFVGNYYKPGPGTDASRVFFNASTTAGANFPKWYVAGNIMEGSPALNTNNWAGFSVSYASGSITDIKSDTLLLPPLANIYNGAWIKYDPYKINTQTAEAAYLSVVQKVGTFNRDSVERRIIREVKTGKAIFKASQGKAGIIDKSYDAEGYLAYPAAIAPVDNDRDGMADAWELANGLNPTIADDRNLLTTSGYTALEVYLNSLLGEMIVHDFTAAGFKQVETHRISLFPTIATDKLTIVSDDSLISATIFSLDGAKMQTVSLINNMSIDVSKLIKGSYLLSIITQNVGIEHFKFIKK
jgi:hypothetical protein